MLQEMGPQELKPKPTVNRNFLKPPLLFRNLSIIQAIMYYTKAFQILAAFAVALPAVHACVAKDALPQATQTITNSKTIEVAAGQTYDGKNARFDRGAGACKEQSEGGE
jgi:hypothetical protein